MASPITLSGFNSIDFSVIIDAIMTQERQPVAALETQKRALETQKSGFGALAAKLASLESAADGLVTGGGFKGTTASVSDASRLTVSSDPSTPEGSYQIYVDQLAHAQVSTSAQDFADIDTTKVAGAGVLRFTTSSGDVDVTLTGDVTLQQLADAINDKDDVPVSASIIRNTSGEYQLMLTGRETGLQNAFTIDTSAFTGAGGGAALSFAQAQGARDAQIRVNGVTTTSPTNAFNGVINGLSFTALKEDVQNPVTITITANYDSVVNLVQKLVTAFNETTGWIEQQASTTAQNATNGIGRDPLVRDLRSQLSNIVTSDYTTGGSFRALAEVGFEFTRQGKLTLDETKFKAALEDHTVDVEKLFRGSNGAGGAFGRMTSAIEEYTKAGGLVLNAQDRVTTQVSQLARRIDDMEDRLAIRRMALQKEYAAADATIAQLNGQKGSLSSLGSQFSLF
jgi:flagellar hook-associated protein 2